MLQSVQNATVRIVCGKSKFDRTSLTPLYESLHWLKVRERIVFKVCLIVHKCVWGIAPESLKVMITLANPRTLQLVEKRFCSEYGRRAFSRAGPKLWNNLPLNLRMEKDTDAFKKLLKSFLITSAESLYRRVNMR